MMMMILLLLLLLMIMIVLMIIILTMMIVVAPGQFFEKTMQTNFVYPQWHPAHPDSAGLTSPAGKSTT